MKKFGKVMLIGISALVVGVIIVAFGPVQLHRMFGGYNKVDRNFYPQWINNEEYCYLRVENYYAPIIIWPTPLQMLDPRGPNATFYIYKVNINEPDKKKLVRKIDAKVSFDLQSGVSKPNINGENFTFKWLDEGELVLIIRGRLKYIAYYFNADGKILKKKVFSANSEFLDWRDIVDISPDGEKLLLNNISELYIKNIKDRQEEFLSVDSKNRWPGFYRFIGNKNLIGYEMKSEKEEIIFAVDIKKNILTTIVTKEVNDYDKEISILLLDVAISQAENFLFLSHLGIFQKQDENWQMIKSLENMNFSFFYPAWSPDGKYLIGITDGDNLKLMKYEDFLKE